MLKQVQHDRTKEKAEIATGTTCPRNGSGAVGLPRRMLTHPHLPKARKRVRNGGCAQWRRGDAETRLRLMVREKIAE